jgi:hypothetical protein
MTLSVLSWTRGVDRAIEAKWSTHAANVERGNRFSVEKADRLERYLAHVLVGEPASTSPEHARAMKSDAGRTTDVDHPGLDDLRPLLRYLCTQRSGDASLIMSLRAHATLVPHCVFIALV